MCIFVERFTAMQTPSIFDITKDQDFDAKALDVFRFQYRNNVVYKEFCSHLGKNEDNTIKVTDIPFLPIEFFKLKEVITGNAASELTFTSSGTTGGQTSRHFVVDKKMYEKSYRTAFEMFYGTINDYCILALLPSYLEREGSSLIYMVADLITNSQHVDSGFYLDDFGKLHQKLVELDKKGTKTLLIGVSFALLDFVETYRLKLKNCIVMETGGMKGRRKELIRSELHQTLIDGFGVAKIHSEYGMTELLSQAYSKGNGVFRTPPWMKVLTRDTEDPLIIQPTGKTGGLNIIDLANVNSCSFIATQDLGKINADGSFEILGRFDNSDIRGCNLMVL